jgi:hypothetical protein
MTNITSTTKHIYSNSNTTQPYINVTGGIGAGNVRYYNNYFQVFDGYSWINLTSNSATISMLPQSEAAIDWAIN